MTKIAITLLLVSVAVVHSYAYSDTPKLNIKTKHGSAKEEERKQQIERQARQYDLKKYTVTRDIVVEQGAINHSSPVLTLNLRFLDNDDRALSAYLHEQGHWVLMERHKRDMRDLYDDLKLRFPHLPVDPPEGDGQERSTYFHLAVIMLEWQGMEELMGTERARTVMEFKRGDHYTAIYAAAMENRERVEVVMKKYGIRW
jgi:hypothetical protein